MDFQVEYVRSADGTSIAMGRGGSGTPLLVVPYMAATIETTWSMCAGAFPDYDLITYDRRGTGLSARAISTRDAQSYFDSTRREGRASDRTPRRDQVPASRGGAPRHDAGAPAERPARCLAVSPDR